jgi:hypothetical protein
MSIYLCELDGRLNRIEILQQNILETAEMTSSTKRFQNNRDTGTEANALCLTSSITKLAITADIGDPIAVPKTC